MAGGIDWFRWHHGTVTDQKFPLVARRAGASVAEVIAVWACLLERASMNDQDRGWLGEGPDFEAMDCALGLDDGKAMAIFKALQQRDLVDEHLHITAWPKRQPKREDDTAAERKRRQRERDHEAAIAGVTGDASRSVTQGHAPNATVSRSVTSGHDRGEESREYISEEAKASSSSPGGDRTGGEDQGDKAPPCPYDALVIAYHEALPSLPRVKLMDDKRRKAMRTFWAWVFTSRRSDGERRASTAQEALAWSEAYFERAGRNDFLMGRAPSRGHENWRADFDFLLTDRGRKHVLEKTDQYLEAQQ